MEWPVPLTDLFKIGIGPSSSHTIGPMRAAASFVDGLGVALDRASKLTATAYGSLAWTGKGHATDKAMILGLAGFRPDSLDPDLAEAAFRDLKTDKRLRLPNGRVIDFDPAKDVVFDTLNHFDRHPNAMQFEALDADNACIASEIWFSIGGGFVEKEARWPRRMPVPLPRPLPLPAAMNFSTSANAPACPLPKLSGPTNMREVAPDRLKPRSRKLLMSCWPASIAA